MSKRPSKIGESLSDTKARVRSNTAKKAWKTRRANLEKDPNRPLTLDEVNEMIKKIDTLKLKEARDYLKVFVWDTYNYPNGMKD
jgi:hypothetical protein